MSETQAQTTPFGRTLRPDIPAGSSYGRYQILEKIGAGGMGVVYLAFDPELDRKVALKLVRVDPRGEEGASEGRQRLLREAQAMARLSHPNVIAVFDVGSIADEVFVAMEYVEGESLAVWLRKEPRRRPWREVRDVFVQAGRGLAAAHQAGLVHRDFKPENVLVGADGRVRVLDFGLARAEGPPPASEDQPVVPGSGRLDAALTRTGHLMGTPAFMAPEQHLLGAIDGRSDQFSFCVALYEGLYGELPFTGGTYKELASAVVKGRLREPPRGAHPPGWLRRAVLRGLSVEPAARFPSMDALLVTLGRDRRVVRRLINVALGGAAVAATAALAVTMTRDPSRACKASGRIADVWGPAARAGVEKGFQATGRAYAGDSFNAVAAELDRYTAAWTAMRDEACETTHKRGQQTGELLDLRLACLDARRDEVRELVAVLATADVAVLDRAPAAVTGLPKLQDCAREPLLASGARPPAPGLRAPVTALRTRVAAVDALRLGGRFNDAVEPARILVDDAAKVDYRPIQAEALMLYGDILGLAGKSKEAVTALAAAARAAQAGRDLRTAVKALVQLAEVNGDTLAHLAEAEDELKEAAAILEGIGGDVTLEAKIASTTGHVADRAGRYDEGLAAYQRTLALLEQAGSGDTLDLAYSVNDLGGSYRRHHQYDKARPLLERALKIRETILGPMHPFVASSIFNLGNLLYTQGKYADSVVYYQRSLDIRERALGPEHTRVAESLVGLAQAKEWSGQKEEGLLLIRRAIAIYEKNLGPDHPDLGGAIQILGDFLRRDSKFEEALAAFRRSAEIREKALGPDHPSLAVSLYAVAEALRALRRFDETLATLERARQIDAKAAGDESPEVAYDLTGIGVTYVVAKRPKEGIAPLEHALAIRTLARAKGDDPTELAETQYMLARALWDGGGAKEKARAVELAGAAEAAYLAAGPGMKEEHDVIVKWLAAHKL